MIASEITSTFYFVLLLCYYLLFAFYFIRLGLQVVCSRQYYYSSEPLVPISFLVCNFLLYYFLLWIIGLLCWWYWLRHCLYSPTLLTNSFPVVPWCIINKITRYLPICCNKGPFFSDCSTSCMVQWMCAISQCLSSVIYVSLNEALRTYVCKYNSCTTVPCLKHIS